MKAVIIGASGFLGKNLSSHLRSKNYDLTLIDLIPSEGLTFILDCPSQLTAEHLRTADVVIHLANKARIPPSWENYKDYYHQNITGSQQIFELCQQAAVKRFVYISSSSVYGNGNTVQKESDVLDPLSPYAVSKMAAEYSLRVQAQKGSTELIIIRPFTMYGYHMDFGNNSLIIAKFIDRFRQGDPLLIEGSGDQRRDFLHVKDAVRGIEILINQGQHGEIYNLGSGKSYSIKEIADLFPCETVFVKDRIGQVTCTCADISKLQSLGFSPTIDLIQWLTSEIQEIKISLLQEG